MSAREDDMIEAQMAAWSRENAVQAADFEEIATKHLTMQHRRWKRIMSFYSTKDLLRIAADLEDLNYATASRDTIAMREMANLLLQEKGL